MYGHTYTIDENDNAILYEDDNDKLTTIQAAQRQINTIISGCHTASSIKESSNCAAACTKQGIFQPHNVPYNTYHLTQSKHRPNLFNNNTSISI